MSKKDKIKVIVAQHEFQLTTTANVDEVLMVIDAAADATTADTMGVRINRTGLTRADHGLSAQYSLRGPGGLVEIANYTVFATDNKNGTVSVRMGIGKYLWRKGGMFQKPRLNASKPLRKFESIVRSQLPQPARAS